MKILILTITITWSFAGGYQTRPSAIIVSSPEEAAIKVYHDKKANNSVEPDHKRYDLFEIDIENNTFSKVSIPEVSFVAPLEAGRDE